MNEMLERDDLMLLNAAMAGVLEPVAPPPALKAQILFAVRGIPQDSVILRAHEGRWTKVADGVRVKTLSFDKARNTATADGARAGLDPAGARAPRPRADVRGERELPHRRAVAPRRRLPRRRRRFASRHGR